jgi:hypothetical protein
VERRLAITYIVSATTTFGIACVAIATASGGLFVSAEPKPGPGKQVEIVDDYIVVHSSTTVLAADTPSPKSALTRAPLPPSAVIAPAPAPAVAPAEAVTADAPLSETPPTAAPASAKVPDEDPAPAPAPSPSAESDDQPEPASAPAITNKPAAPASGPAARPPVPPGCHDPEFSHGTWKCDDD